MPPIQGFWGHHTFTRWAAPVAVIYRPFRPTTKQFCLKGLIISRKILVLIQVNQKNPMGLGLHPNLYNNHRYGIHAGGNKNADGGFIKPLIDVIGKN